MCLCLLWVKAKQWCSGVQHVRVHISLMLAVQESSNSGALLHHLASPMVWQDLNVQQTAASMC